METARHKTVTRSADTQQPAAVQKSPQALTVATSNGVRLQTATKVSDPRDPAEQEAESTSKKIMRMAVPESSIAYVKTGSGGVFRQVKQKEKDKKLQPKLQSPYLSRFADSGVFAQRREDKLQRTTEGQANVAPKVSADIQGSMASGTPLPLGVRRVMEPRFRADFGQVKIHTGDKSAKLSRRLNAKAFTVGNQVFFGQGKFQPDSQEGKELIAHELTHTIQQGGSVQRSAEPIVHEHSEPQVQRLFGIDTDPRAYLAKKADDIPGFAMLTVVIGYNPITNAKVDRSAGNLLRGAIKMIPVAGVYIAEALENHGIFDKVSQFVSGQFDTLKDIGSSLIDNIEAFIKGVSITDLVHPGEVIERGKRIITSVIDRIITLATGLKDTIITLIKDAILKPIAAFAKASLPNGYDILCALLGKDPISGEPVPSTAESLIAPFMKLIGQEEVWNTMKEAKAIPRAWAWFQGALGEVKGFVQQIPILFVNALKALDLMDILAIPLAFNKLVGVFGGFVGKFTDWAGTAVWNLLEIIFDVVSPAALAYVKKTGTAFKSILKNPMPFVMNLVNAAKLGFLNFANNFGTHLKTGLIDWLVGALPGVHIPKAFELGEIVKFAFSVLSISWQMVREKLVKVVGEPAVKAMETGFDIVVTLVKEGPPAAWDKIKDELAKLKDMVIGGITGFITDTVVKKAIPKLVTLFIPGLGFIAAILSIYEIIMVFVNKLAQIGQVVKGFIDSLANIAAGAIDVAATRVETTLAGIMSLAISFLTSFAGLSKVSDKIMDVFAKVRGMVDKALDALVNWIVTMAKKLKTAAGKVKQVAKGTIEQARDLLFGPRVEYHDAKGEKHEVWVEESGNRISMLVASGKGLTIQEKAIGFNKIVQGLTDGNVKKDASELIKQLGDIDHVISRMELKPKNLQSNKQQKKIEELKRDAISLLKKIEKITKVKSRKATLRLNGPKKTYVGEYKEWSNQGLLRHSVAYERLVKGQVAAWEAEFDKDVYEKLRHGGKQLGIEDKKYILRPDWDDTGEKLPEIMEVDHKVEVQVFDPKHYDVANAIGNLQLMDHKSNKDSGEQIRDAIANERRQLAETENDKEWLACPLEFNEVVAGTGSPGKTWTYKKIREGEHLKALAKKKGLEGALTFAASEEKVPEERVAVQGFSLEDEKKFRMVLEHTKTLSSAERSAITAHRLEGKSLDTIAKELGQSTKGVKKLIDEGLKRLRNDPEISMLHERLKLKQIA